MILCQLPIWLDDGDPHVNTYCMRERGHAGKHNIVNQEPPQKRSWSSSRRQKKMPRSLPSPMLSAFPSNAMALCYLVDIQLASGAAHVWSGVGSVVWNGNTYLGVGSLGAVGEVSEGSDVRADGTSIALSGIDPALLNDTVNDIQVGAPATVWLALFSEGTIVCAYSLFAGTVDKPSLGVGPETFTIALGLETRMANLQRPSNRRYTSADQRNYYPLDSGFDWVETLNDIALLWG